jgi:hypothetical protein
MPLVDVLGIDWNRLSAAGFEFACAFLARIQASQSLFEGQLAHSSPEQICLEVGGNQARARDWRGQNALCWAFAGLF